MRYLILAALIVAFSTVSPVHAQEEPDITETGMYLFGFQCAPREAVKKFLAARGENIVATANSQYIGAGRELGAVEVLQSDDNGNWSVIVHFPDVSCNIIHGTDWVTR